MNMQNFYRRLSMKPSKAHQRRLANLMRVSRTQVLKATGDVEWFVWHTETHNM